MTGRIDCVLPPPATGRFRPFRFRMEPANITAIANDVGTEADLPAPVDRAGAARRCGHRHFHQRRLAQHHLALEEARKRELLTVALLGYDGGEILRRGLADFPVIVRSDYIPRIQEVQASIYHIIRETLEVLHMAKLELFGTASCPYTQEMREWLEWTGVEFVEYDVEADRSRARAHARAGRRPAHRARSGGRRQSGADRLAGPRLRGRGEMKMASACSIRVRGVVQGVGFRPFVYRLARANTLAGWVLNGEEGVEIHLEGAEPALQAFVHDLQATAAARGQHHGDRRSAAPKPPGLQRFHDSRQPTSRRQPTVRISPDLPVCDDCLAELFDPRDPRYHYPYINCTNCGPRYYRDS